MATTQEEHLQELSKGYRFGWSDPSHSVFVPKKGLSEAVVEEISAMKSEPDWMRKFRLKSLKHFQNRPMPWWGADLSDIDFDDIYYFIRSTEKQAQSWEDLPDDIKGTWDKLGIPEAEKKYLGGVSAQYECLRGSTLVWTAAGMRAIKELGAGDRVFSLNEATRQIEVATVRAQASSGEKEVFEITAGARVIGASANHPFLVLRDERRPGRVRARYAKRWLPVEELRVGDFVAVATDTPDFGESSELLVPDAPKASTFPHRTSEDLCWWAGFYLGDGYLHHRGAQTGVEFAVNKNDTELIEELERTTFELFGIRLALASDGLRLCGHGTAVLADFILLNGLGGTAHSKRVPDWVHALPRSERLAFLAGFVDADGYVRNHSKNKDVVITSVSADLLEDLRQLARLGGIGGSRVVRFTNRHPTRSDQTLTAHRLFLSGRFDRLPCRNPRRADRLSRRRYGHRYRTAKGTDFRHQTSEMLGFARIESIESVGVEPVYDIEVEGHHNFVAEGFIAHNSEVVYHKIKKELDDIGVLFTDMDSALRDHPDLVREYFGTIIPPNDNKFAALNSAVWSGGSFIYVPPGVQVDIPLQAYFRINAENMGQFERTLIIADEGSYVHYVEGCSAPIYTTDSLHSAVVEIIAKKGARVRYTTIQNWSTNVYNLVTKRAAAYEDAVMEWIDGNIGCLTGETQIFTGSRGPVAIKDLRPGDTVFAYDLDSVAPVERGVVALKDSGVQPVYRLRTKNHREIKATGNHPFLVLEPASAQGSPRLGWRMLDDIRVGDRVGVVRGLPDRELPRDLSGYRYAGNPSRRPRTQIELPTQTDEALMWLLGAYIGDGYMDRSPSGVPRRVYFAVPPLDRARTKLEVALKEVFGIEGRQKGPVALAIGSTVLADFLLWLGMEGTARTKRIPDWIWTLPISQRLAFIEGFLDTDGHIRNASERDGTQYGQVTFVSANRELLEDLKLLAISCGLNPGKISRYVKERKLVLGKEWKEYVSYSLSMNLRENLDAILLHTAPSQALEFVPVVEIVPLPAEPTYDIEVEGVHNFVANGLLVHNSKVTMKYPSIYLLGKGARGEVLSVAYAGKGMHTDAGGKAIHAAPYTTSVITSKSVSKDGGRTGYRGLIRVEPDAHHAKSNVRCDALILDEDSRSDTYPYIEVEDETASLGHEATVSKVGDDQLFYLMSRGLSEVEATAMIVNGFIEPITRELPMEYAVELNRLIELQMEGSVG